MLNIIFLILILYVIYKLLIRVVMRKSTDHYLEQFKKKFYTNNPHINKNEKEEGADKQSQSFQFRKQINRNKIGKHHG